MLYYESHLLSYCCAKEFELSKLFEFLFCMTMAERRSLLGGTSSRGSVKDGNLESSVADAVHDHEDNQGNNKQNCLVKVLNFIFTVCCRLCGLFFTEKSSKFFLFCQFMVISAFCLGHAALAIALEVCRINNSSCSFMENENCTLPHEYWKISTAVTLSTVTASLSYFLMIVVILTSANYTYCESGDKNCWHKVCCCTLRKLTKGPFLSPFKDKDQPTGDQAVFFCLNYFLSISVWFVYMIASIVYAILVESKSHCTINVLNLVWYVLHACFHFIAIHSCFMFSKVIYIATNKLERISESLDQVDKKPASIIISEELKDKMPERDREVLIYLNDIKKWLESNDKDKRDKEQFRSLQSIYQSFVEKVNPTLNLLGYWFIAHWLLHALTTVLLSAVIIETFAYSLRYEVIKVDEMLNIKDDGLLKDFYLVYLIFFALEHAYLFLYPCFRAASIAATRVKLMNKIFKKQWNHISLNVNAHFVQYLATHDFAFKVPIFCAEISFGASMACVSLIFALYGGLITLND